MAPYNFQDVSVWSIFQDVSFRKLIDCIHDNSLKKKYAQFAVLLEPLLRPYTFTCVVKAAAKPTAKPALYLFPAGASDGGGDAVHEYGHWVGYAVVLKSEWLAGRLPSKMKSAKSAHTSQSSSEFAWARLQSAEVLLSFIGCAQGCL